MKKPLQYQFLLSLRSIAANLSRYEIVTQTYPEN